MFFFTRNLFLCTQCESIDGQGQIEEYPPQGSFCQVCTVLPHNVLFCTGSVQMWRKHEERVGCGARALIPPGVNAGVRAGSSPRLDNQKEPSTHFTFGSHTSTPPSSVEAGHCPAKINVLVLHCIFGEYVVGKTWRPGWPILG